MTFHTLKKTSEGVKNKFLIEERTVWYMPLERHHFI